MFNRLFAHLTYVAATPLLVQGAVLTQAFPGVAGAKPRPLLPLFRVSLIA